MGSRTPRSASAIFVGVVALALLFESVLRGAVAWERSFNPDEFQHVQRAWLVAQGFVPFRDFYDHHAPLGDLALAAVVGAFDPEIDPVHATLVFRLGRVAGWIVSGLLLLSTWRLGRTWGGPAVGLLAAVLLSGTVIFADKAIEIRPDGMSVVLWLEALRWGVTCGPGRARWLAAGALAGLALSANLKLAVALPALLPAVARANGSASRNLVTIAAGGALGVAPTIVLLALQGALDDFVREALVGSLTAARTLSFWRFVGETVTGDPEVACVGMVGLVATLVRLRRSPRPGADAAIAVAAALPIASLVIMPEPWQQFFLIFLPVLAILAARVVVGIAETAATVFRRARLAPAILVSAAAASAIFATVQLRPAALVRWDNRGQLSWLRWLVAETPTWATVLAGWGTPAVFRRPATWRPFHPVAFILRMDAAERAAIVRTLEDPETRPDLVFLDAHLEAIAPRIPLLVREHYEPTGKGGVWVRRGLDGVRGRR